MAEYNHDGTTTYEPGESNDRASAAEPPPVEPPPEEIPPGEELPPGTRGGGTTEAPGHLPADRPGIVHPGGPPHPAHPIAPGGGPSLPGRPVHPIAPGPAPKHRG